MNRLDPYADPGSVFGLIDRLKEVAANVDRPVTLMEVCGTHTNAIAAAGLRRLLPSNIRLIAGPGCPVCVTPVGYVDRAEALAHRPGTIVCTFGDLLRVPSSKGSLERARAAGAQVQVVYSPRDALKTAADNPSSDVVFLGVGFETTVPTVAATLREAESLGVKNLKVLSGHKVMPPPLRALAGDPEVRVDGLLCPGHVSVITGAEAFSFLPREFGLPAAVVGFTPTDVVRGVIELVSQLAEGRAEVANLYARVVTDEGNKQAQAMVDQFFEPADTEWRGLGTIPGSGLALRPRWTARDAQSIDVTVPEPLEPEGCRCGDILKGTIDPPHCPLFDKVCTPDNPVGACMVSSEGTCSAWYRHERLAAAARP